MVNGSSPGSELSTLRLTLKNGVFSVRSRLFGEVFDGCKVLTCLFV